MSESPPYIQSQIQGGIVNAQIATPLLHNELRNTLLLTIEMVDIAQYS